MVWAVLANDQIAALEELRNQQNSDRIVAILGGAMLDDSLRQTLEWRLRHSEGINSNLDIGRPLGNLGPKIDLAYQLYVFERDTHDAFIGLSEFGTCSPIA